MKNRFFLILAVITLLTLCLFGCGKSSNDTVALPDIGINWDSILPRITEEKLSQYGLFADMESLQADTQDFGSVTFCNYDPAESDAFKEVEYQLTAEYGLGCEYENGTAVYSDAPVYSIGLVDNNSDSYYFCTCSEAFELLSEEGEWFLSEDKEEFTTELLENCRTMLFGE